MLILLIAFWRRALSVPIIIDILLDVAKVTAFIFLVISLPIFSAPS